VRLRLQGGVRKRVLDWQLQKAFKVRAEQQKFDTVIRSTWVSFRMALLIYDGSDSLRPRAQCELLFERRVRALVVHRSSYITRDHSDKVL